MTHSTKRASWASLCLMASALLAMNTSGAQTATPSANMQPASLPAQLRDIPRGAPIVMLNMLRFRDAAQYADGRKLSGREAYQLYRDGASKLVAKAGGNLVWRGETKAHLIAPTGEHWDEVFLVRYPSIEAFIAMTSSDAYKQVALHRTAALADSRLIANVEVKSGAVDAN